MLYKLSKVTYVIFIYYIIWFQNAFFQVPGLPMILGVSMIGLLLLHKLFHKEKLSIMFLTPMKWWVAFAIFIFYTGYFIAVDQALLIDSIFSYVQTLIMMIYIIDISVREKSVDFFVKTLVLLGIIVSVNLVFYGFDRYGQIMISENSNPNSDGLTVLFSLSALLLVTEIKFNLKSILSYLLMFFFTYAVILTSSRKSFLAVLVMIFMWFFFVYLDYLKKYMIILRILIVIVILGVASVAIFYVIPIFLESNLYYRLTEGVGYEGDELRLVMYRTAYKHFVDSPLIGIGFNQFRVAFGTYSHSTYAEIISSAGLLGTILYFVPYGIIIVNLFRVLYYSKDIIVKNQAKLFLILMLVLLILGAGVIHFYGISFNILFSLMIAFYYIELKKIKEHSHSYLL